MRLNHLDKTEAKVPFPILITGIVFMGMLLKFWISDLHSSQLFEKIDEYLTGIINSNRRAFLDEVIHRFTTPYFWVPFYCSVVLFLLHADKVRFTRKIGFAVGYLVLSTGCLMVINLLFDHTVPYRLRPLILPDKASTGFETGYLGCLPLSGVAAGLSLLLVSFLGRTHYIINTGLVLWASLILCASAYAGFHYPTELVAGMIICLLLAVLCSLAYKCYSQKYHAN